MRSLKAVGFAAFAVLFAALVLSTGAAAQTRKAKPKPLATPPVTRPLTDAEIISRAGDYDQQQADTASDTQTTPAASAGTAKPAASNTAASRRELDARLKKLESNRQSDYEERQKMLLMNLDILTRAEARSDSLRKQVFDLTDKESNIKQRLDQIELDIQPESIERTLQLTGSMHPEVVREAKRKSLEAERTNLNNLLSTVQSVRINAESSLQRSDELVEKLRTKLEKDIDQSLIDNPTDTNKPPEEEEQDQ